MNTTRQERKVCRVLAGLDPRDTRPVVVVKGNRKPYAEGESYHWTNRSGERIYRPMAYARKGWSSIVYHPSTRVVTVGELWLQRYTAKNPELFIAETRRALRQAEVET